MPHWKTFFKSDYIRACDLDGHGDVAMTIQRMGEDDVPLPDGNKTEKKFHSMLRIQ